MLSVLKSLVSASVLSLAVVALAPAAAHAAQPVKAPLVLAQDAPAAAGGGKVWFAFMWPENLKPQLEEKKMLLTIVGLLPFGAVWGPIALLGQGFDMEWALPPLIFSIIGFFGYWAYVLPGVVIGWFATQVMFANLNRPEITVGGGDAAK